MERVGVLVLVLGLMVGMGGASVFKPGETLNIEYGPDNTITERNIHKKNFSVGEENLTNIFVYSDEIVRRYNTTTNTSNMTFVNETETIDHFISWNNHSFAYRNYNTTGANDYPIKIEKHWVTRKTDKHGRTDQVDLTLSVTTTELGKWLANDTAKDDGKHPERDDVFNRGWMFKGGDINESWANDLSAELDNMPFYKDGTLEKNVNIPVKETEGPKNVTLKFDDWDSTDTHSVTIGNWSVDLTVDTDTDWTNEGSLFGMSASGGDISLDSVPLNASVADDDDVSDAGDEGWTTTIDPKGEGFVRVLRFCENGATSVSVDIKDGTTTLASKSSGFSGGAATVVFEPSDYSRMLTGSDSSIDIVISSGTANGLRYPSDTSKSYETGDFKYTNQQISNANTCFSDGEDFWLEWGLDTHGRTAGSAESATSDTGEQRYTTTIDTISEEGYITVLRTAEANALGNVTVRINTSSTETIAKSFTQSDSSGHVFSLDPGDYNRPIKTSDTVTIEWISSTANGFAKLSNSQSDTTDFYSYSSATVPRTSGYFDDRYNWIEFTAIGNWTGDTRTDDNPDTGADEDRTVNWIQVELSNDDDDSNFSFQFETLDASNVTTSTTVFPDITGTGKQNLSSSKVDSIPSYRNYKPSVLGLSGSTDDWGSFTVFTAKENDAPSFENTTVNASKIGGSEVKKVQIGFSDENVSKVNSPTNGLGTQTTNNVTSTITGFTSPFNWFAKVTDFLGVVGFNREVNFTATDSGLQEDDFAHTTANQQLNRSYGIVNRGDFFTASIHFADEGTVEVSGTNISFNLTSGKDINETEVWSGDFLNQETSYGFTVESSSVTIGQGNTIDYTGNRGFSVFNTKTAEFTGVSISPDLVRPFACSQSNNSVIDVPGSSTVNKTVQMTCRPGSAEGMNINIEANSPTEDFDRYNYTGTLNISTNETKDTPVRWKITEGNLSQWSNREPGTEKGISTIGGSTDVTVDDQTGFVVVTFGTGHSTSSLDDRDPTVALQYDVKTSGGSGGGGGGGGGGGPTPEVLVTFEEENMTGTPGQTVLDELVINNFAAQENTVVLSRSSDADCRFISFQKTLASEEFGAKGTYNIPGKATGLESDVRTVRVDVEIDMPSDRTRLVCDVRARTSQGVAESLRITVMVGGELLVDRVNSVFLDAFGFEPFRSTELCTSLSAVNDDSVSCAEEDLIQISANDLFVLTVFGLFVGFVLLLLRTNVITENGGS